MELNDIMTLVKAGFTKDEIMQMVSSPADTVQKPVEPETPPAEQAEEQKPVQTPEQTPVQTPVPSEPTQPTMSDIMQGIAKLTSAVQANAIAQSVIPQGALHQQTAEDMLAEIIRPTYKERSL